MSHRELPLLRVETTDSHSHSGTSRSTTPVSPGTIKNVRASVSPTNEAQGFVGLYNFKEKIGRGHFGVVRLAEHALTKEKVAVKIIDKQNLDPEIREQLYNEVRFMKLLKHPHIVSLYEVCETPTQLYLILELADGGDLFDKITQNGKLSEEQARNYFRQILSAVVFCHSLHIAHRDLKPENVLLVGDTLKVSDFGMSADFSPGTMLDAAVGSLAYSAPEILLGDKYYGESVDVWSLGVTLYMMVCGKLPFDDANPSETVVDIMEGNFRLDTSLSESLRHLLTSMLTVDVNQRISLSGVADHPWVTQNGEDPLDKMTEEEELNAVEVAQIMATLATLKIDTEQVKKDIAGNTHNYNVATYHLLRLQLLRERREKQRQKSALLSALQVPKGMKKSPSSEAAFAKDGAKSPSGDPHRTFSAEGVGVLQSDVVDVIARKEQFAVPQPQPSPATSYVGAKTVLGARSAMPQQWRFGSHRRARQVEFANEDTSDAVMIKAHSSPSQAASNEAGGPGARQRPKSTSVSTASLARSRLTPSQSLSDMTAPKVPPPGRVITSSSDAELTVPVKLDRPNSGQQVQRNINLISEESGEDETSGPNTPRMSARGDGEESPGSFYRSPLGARSMPSLHFLRMRANTNDRLQTNQTVLVPMADPDSDAHRTSPTRTQRQDTTLSVQSLPCNASGRPGSLGSDSATFGDNTDADAEATAEVPNRSSSRGGAVRQRLKDTCTIS